MDVADSLLLRSKYISRFGITTSLGLWSKVFGSKCG